ncbi:MAG: helix-turn-helix transcriptional regulator [Lachnospiraceae bacterium]|nr:helix-turn-helix transcriptional regulator [Lachnospiraceae bacterium]
MRNSYLRRIFHAYAFIFRLHTLQVKDRITYRTHLLPVPFINKSYFYKVGNNIKYLRDALGETQDQLGLAIGESKSSVSQVETGIRPPTLDFLIKLAKHFCITIDEILFSDLSYIPNFCSESHFLKI